MILFFWNQRVCFLNSIATVPPSFFARYFSIVRNRCLYIHLFPESSRVSKEHPPLARFILRVSVAGSPRKFHISPGNYALTPPSPIHSSSTHSLKPSKLGYDLTYNLFSSIDFMCVCVCLSILFVK